MDQIEKANAACALANITTRATIHALKAAIVEVKEMRDSGEVPDDCLEALNDHLFWLKNHKDQLRGTLRNRKQTCSALTDCLADHDIIITPQDGGGK